MPALLLIFSLWQLFSYSFADHYKGGTISWKPVNPSVIGGPSVTVTFTQRHSWAISRYPCNDTTINALGIYNDTNPSAPATLSCISSLALCTSSLFQTINAPLFCTDYSTVFQISSGTYYITQTLAINSIIDVAMRGASWANEVGTNEWSLLSHVDLTPISGKINTSPVTGSLPVFQTYESEIRDIQILAYDVDFDQVVRCRWSNQVPLDECGDVCLNLPNAQINSVDCIVTWTPVRRPADIASGLTVSTYVVAITAEDFVNASSTKALSSAAHQMLVYVSLRPAGACASRPTVSAFPRRNVGCYGVSVGSINSYNFRGSVQSSCLTDTIVDFVSSSPLFTTRSALYQVSNYTWGIDISWTANSNQTGLQPFCVAAVDNFGQSSDQYCVMIMVNSANPNLLTPVFVQSTASPVGTVMFTQTRFTIQANIPLRRTLLNSTYITIYRLDNYAVAYQIDCKYSPDIYFQNTTLVFFVASPAWVLGVTYFITMTDGVATSADLYCGTEGAGFNANNIWRFTIWDPAASSTTSSSTTTSTATTHTVTTRGLGTTTYNTLFTTTGIPAYIVTTTTSTTSTTATTVTTATTTSVTSATSTTTTTTGYIPEANVLYPKDLETQCLQPVVISVALITAAMIPLHLYAMITLFSKMNAHFQKDILRARKERQIRLRSAISGYEAERQTLV